MSSPHDTLSLVGTTIAEKYAIEAVVGEGGFACVYRAMHLVWKRPVAVKVFKALGEVPADQRGKLLEDFIQEGALLADLSERSTAIVQARDVGTTKTGGGEDVPFMVLEWLDGKPLDAMLEAERATSAPLRSLSTMVAMLDPVAEALALAHKKGIAHRDVKPANIFVLGGAADGSGGVKLLDFGIAKVVQDAQKMGFGKTAGHITSFTPLYGAPEQFNRAYGATGPWTDVFALALVAAEVVSGREPMSGDSLVQLAYASADTAVRPTPRTLGVATSDEVEAVFRKAVAVDPKERYQTAGELWSALKSAVSSDSTRSVAALRAAAPPPSSHSDTVADTGSGHPTAATAPLAAAATVAAPPSSSSVASSPSPTAATAMPAAPPAKSRTPLVVGLVVVALAGGGGAFALRSGGSGESAPPSAASQRSSASAVAPSAAPSASAAPTAAKQECPPGMVLVSGGEFFMGSDEKDAQDFERPPHKVKLSPYCIDVTETTVAQYKQCSDKGGCRRAGKENVWNGITAAQKKSYDALCNANDLEGRAQHPINCVDWDQAREACEFRGARLPTEAEWEYAARGSDGRIYPWGDEAPGATLLNACGSECVAWMKKHPEPGVVPAFMYPDDDGHVHTAPVGSFPKGKSRWGLMDVVGNVWEWVSDWYADYDKALATKTSTDPTGPASGTERVLRGGGWNGSMPSWVRPSFRFREPPTVRSHGYGFRCAKAP
ncbi:MAG: SUMF1/EgtB/PvdO family nonheme iron enzyme [Deltaproteobacteria bacterium]|nr:SUMF1/EgtB/PvdO family nonheme iron enzyme [Deltaproteobacteria bacterium]